MNNSTQDFLKAFKLLNIDGYEFIRTMDGGSAQSCIYQKGTEKIVVKFLIAPRNDVELERFKLEAGVLKLNRLHDLCFIPSTSYPLPRLKIELSNKGLVYFFAYEYCDGTLLSDLDTSKYTVDDRLKLLHRISSALNYLNLTGYSHRDLHPQNIILKENPRLMDVSSAEPPDCLNDPRVVFLDWGTCVKSNSIEHLHLTFNRSIDESLVTQENNKRLISSFNSMPPDFLIHGEDTINYDSYSFGIFAYSIFFNKLPYNITSIKDVSKLRKRDARLLEDMNRNLAILPEYLQLILRRLLAPNGRERVEPSAIVRIFEYTVYRKDDLLDRLHLEQLLNNGGILYDDDNSHHHI